MSKPVLLQTISHYSNDSRNLSNWHELVDLVQMWAPIDEAKNAYDCTTNKATRSPKISGQQVQKLTPQLVFKCWK